MNNSKYQDIKQQIILDHGSILVERAVAGLFGAECISASFDSFVNKMPLPSKRNKNENYCLNVVFRLTGKIYHLKFQPPAAGFYSAQRCKLRAGPQRVKNWLHYGVWIIVLERRRTLTHARALILIKYGTVCNFSHARLDPSCVLSVSACARDTRQHAQLICVCKSLRGETLAQYGEHVVRPRGIAFTAQVCRRSLRLLAGWMAPDSSDRRSSNELLRSWF